MKTKKLLSYIFCGIAGGMGAAFGGIFGIVAVIIGISAGYILKGDKP
jgi:hypothetical protein